MISFKTAVEHMKKHTVLLAVMRGVFYLTDGKYVIVGKEDFDKLLKGRKQ